MDPIGKVDETLRYVVRLYKATAIPMHDQWRVEEYEIAYHDVAILSFSDFLTGTTNGDLQLSR